MNNIRLGIFGLGMALVGLSGPAQAAPPMSTQTVGGYTFSTTGTASVTSPVIPIAPFTAGLPTSLTSVKIYFQGTKPSFGGQAGLLPGFGGSKSFTATGTPTFNFSSGAGSLTTTAGSITLNPSSAGSNSVSAASGNFNGIALGGISTNTLTLQTYFSGSPQIASYSMAYSGNSAPVGGSVIFDGAIGQVLPTTLSGQFYIQYEYTLPPSATTPGPLPLLGAGAAFTFSRQIRRRIKSSV
jgi:hypothetical protein